jgi:hypothetical protein
LASELFAEGVLEMSNARVAIKTAKKQKKMEAQAKTDECEQTVQASETGDVDEAEVEESKLVSDVPLSKKKVQHRPKDVEPPVGRYENAAEKKRRKKKRKLMEALSSQLALDSN